MNDEWMNKLRQLADDYGPEPPADLPARISRELARRGVQSAGARVVTLRRWAVAAVAAAAVTVGVVFWMRPAGHRDLPAGTMVAQRGPAAKAAHRAGGGHGAVPGGAEALVASAPLTQVSRAVAKPVAAADIALAAGPPDVPTADETATTPPAATPAEASAGRDTVRRVRRSRFTDDAAPLLASADLPRDSRAWRVGAFYGSAGGSGAGPTASQEPPGDFSQASYADAGLPYDAAKLQAVRAPETDDPPTTTHEHHHQPLRVGLSVSRRLNARWSLQTGLVYSKLSSELVQEQRGVMQSTVRQRLHYVGLPLMASYSLWRTPHVNVYASAGGCVEQLVSGRQTEDHSDRSTRVSEHRPVFSLLATAGVEYLGTPRLSVFAEPGAACYLHNGSGVHSAYTDKPLGLHLNVGVRVTVK